MKYFVTRYASFAATICDARQWCMARIKAASLFWCIWYISSSRAERAIILVEKWILQSDKWPRRRNVPFSTNGKVDDPTRRGVICLTVCCITYVHARLFPTPYQEKKIFRVDRSEYLARFVKSVPDYSSSNNIIGTASGILNIDLSLLFFIPLWIGKATRHRRIWFIPFLFVSRPPIWWEYATWTGFNRNDARRIMYQAAQWQQTTLNLTSICF